MKTIAKTWTYPQGVVVDQITHGVNSTQQTFRVSKGGVGVSLVLSRKEDIEECLRDLDNGVNPLTNWYTSFHGQRILIGQVFRND